MSFDYGYTLGILPQLLLATLITFEATLGGMALALVVGLALALMRLSPYRLLDRAARQFIAFIRGTPLLIQLYFLFYVLPLHGLAFDPLVTGVIGLGVHYGTYLAEVYRAGIQGLPRGQWEAAVALNLPRFGVWRRIILPQAVPPMIPVFGNYLIAMFKDTPLLATITVLELLGTAQAEAALSYRYFEPYTLVGLIFLALSLPAAWLVQRLETSHAFGNRRA